MRDLKPINDWEVLTNYYIENEIGIYYKISNFFKLKVQQKVSWKDLRGID